MRVPLSNGFVDLQRSVAVLPAGEIRLSPNETKLLEYLVERPGRTIEQAELLTEVFGYAPTVRSRTVISTMQRLRSKIESDPASPVHLQNVFGRGYRFEPLGEPEGLLGRADDLAALRQALEAGRVWLVAPGGFGKTTLARHLADLHGGDALWVDLSEVHSADEVLQAIAYAMGLPRFPDADAASLALGDRAPALLVLDAAEYASVAVKEVLDAISPVAPVLVTSRTPCPDQPLFELGPIGADAARRLFHRSLPHAIEAERIDGITDRLGGIPLAIELAGARLGAFEPEVLRAHLDDLQVLLAGGEEDHQTSMQDVLTWSWERTPEVSRSALAGLLPGWRGLDVADAIALIPGDAMSALAALRQRGWVREVDGRFSLLDPIRQFLERVCPLEAPRARHRQHFLEQARTREWALQVGAANGWVQRQFTHLEDAIESGLRDRDAAAAELVWLLHSRLGAFLPTERLLSWLDRSVALAEGRLHGDLVLARVKIWGYRASVDAAELDLDRARTLEHTPGMWAYRCASIMRMRGRLDEAAAQYREAMDTLPVTWRLHAQLLLGNVLRLLGDHDGAEQLLLAALARSEIDSAPTLRTLATGNLGWLYADQDQFDRARASYEEALESATRSDDLGNSAAIHILIGNLHRFEGRSVEAMHHWAQAEALSRRIGQRTSLATARVNLGVMAMVRGELVDAEQWLDQSHHDFRRAGYPGETAFVCLQLGRLRSIQGRFDAAETWWSRAEADLPKPMRWELWVERCIARAEQGDADAARALLANAEPPDHLARVSVGLAEGFCHAAALDPSDPHGDSAHRVAIREALNGAAGVKDVTVLHIVDRLRATLRERPDGQEAHGGQE